ncbi:S8 family serine peptidase, partial [Tessaracoccus lubricantis]|uniref:S8 family serine peptidase n=1 Tax=Tessaracoccus lubricantis TaxID=545543 RepID=UPI00363A19AF
DDCGGHGTHVAGIVGANGQVTGVAPEATLGAYRVFGCDGGTETDVILAAMERAQADGMDVVNLSLGASFEAWAEYPTAQAADRLAASGVVVVAAVGNDGEYLGQSLGAPATGHDVIAVAAFESETTPTPAGFSSWGLAADLTLKPDVGAPGVGIWSTMPLEKTSRHGGMSGTSMASPHVAGAVALLLEAHPGLTPAEALARLQNTARAADRKPTAQQGAGLIRVDRAATTAALVTPSKISAGESADGPRTTTLTISNPSTTAVTWTPTHQPVDTSRPAPGGGLTQNTLTLGAEQARVTFSRASVTVPPGRTAELTVTIDAPAAAVTGTVYGGFVVLTPDVGEPRRVPFAGMAGDYGSVELLPSMNKGLTTLANASCSASWGPICFDENPAWSAADQGAGFGPSRLPSVALHLAYPARSLQFAVFRADSKGLPVASSREGLLRWDRMGRSPGVLLLTWDGLQQTADGLKPAPDGRYVLGLAVEAPDGDGRIQQWYSRAFSYGQVASSPTPTPTTSPTPTGNPTPTRTPTPTASPSPSSTPAPSSPSSPTPTRTATATPGPTKPPAKQFQRTAPYTLAGTHSYNGRQWFTQCEPYSATERCRTDIWATVVVIEDGQFVRRNGWAFNNLTYLPLMTRSAWGANPLAHHDMDGFTSGGRQWRTECDTAQTGRGACRSYTLTTVYSATPSASGGYRFGQANAWVFNNIVMFS